VEVRTEKIGEVTVIAPEGTIDSRTAPQFEKPALEALAKGERRIVVDFSKVDFTSSAGLRVLLMLGKRLAPVGGTLVLCGVNEGVRKVLEVSGLTSALPTVATREEALQRGAAQSAGLADLAADLLRRGDPTAPAAVSANPPAVDRDLPGLAEKILSLGDKPRKGKS
jgi:anti-anti-sigma factor